MVIKRKLLGTTAMVAATLAMPGGALAEAKPLRLTVGGYMEQWLGFVSYDAKQGEDVTDVDEQQDAEIWFQGSTTLDNGISFHVNVQLEAAADADQIDEAYMFVRGDFGEVLIGMENGAAYAMHFGFGDPGIGINLNTGDLDQWFLAPNAFHLSGTLQGLRNRDNDSNKVRYISPRIAGFQVGMDYSPEARQDDDRFPTEAKNNSAAPEQVWSVAANYRNRFGDVEVGASAGFQGIGDGNGVTGPDPYNFGVGARVGYGGLVLSGSWTHEHDFGGGQNLDSRDVVGGAVAYRSGPLRMGFDVAYGTQSYVMPGAKDTTEIAFQVGMTYVLGPGAEWRGGILYADQQDGNDVSGNDASGIALASGIRLIF